MWLTNKKVVQPGSTIIEVLIALVLVGTVLTAVAVTLSRSVSNSASARYREIATTMAQDMVEVFHYERAKRSWNGSTDGFHSVVANNRTYCANDLADDSIADFQGSPCTGNGVQVSGVGFRREMRAVQTTINSNEAVELTVTISWDAGNTGRQEVEVKQVFQDWR